jgi:hypothetical protein
MVAKKETVAEEAESDALITEMLLTVDEVEKQPTRLTIKEILHRGDEDLPIQMVVGALKEAGYVYIYDTKTRERSLCDRDMLKTKLRQTRPDGTRVFTVDKPKTPPFRGSIKCLLHPDSTEREHYNQMGLPTCRKSNLINEYERDLHMQKKHKQEWRTLEARRARREREEDRELQRALIASAQGKGA